MDTSHWARDFRVVRANFIKCIDQETKEIVLEYCNFHDYWQIVGRLTDTAGSDVSKFRRITFESNLVSLSEITQDRYDKFIDDCLTLAGGYEWSPINELPAKPIEIPLR